MKKMLVLLCFYFSACGFADLNTGENFGNLLNTPQGLVLTEEEHPTGWGKPECTLCHNLENIHLEDRTGTGLDINTIRNDAINNGIAGCSTCHGNNGI